MQVLTLTIVKSGKTVYVPSDKIVCFQKAGDGTEILLQYGKGLGYVVKETPEQINHILTAGKESGSWG